MLFTSCITEKFICKNLESFCHYYFLFQFFFVGISTIPTETCLTEDWFLCLNIFGWQSIFFLHSKLINHTLELKLKSLLLGRRLISLYPDHLIWLQKKMYTYTHVFILSLYQTEFSQVFYICMLLALETEVLFQFHRK